MKTVWREGVDKEAQDAIEAVLKNSFFRTQFLRILKSRWDTIDRKGLREEDYDTQDWVHKQAFNNGRLSMLKEIVELIGD
jgi:hypothetical protein